MSAAGDFGTLVMNAIGENVAHVTHLLRIIRSAGSPFLARREMDRSIDNESSNHSGHVVLAQQSVHSMCKELKTKQKISERR